VFLSGGPGFGVIPLKPWADTLSKDFECILFEQRGIGLSGNVKMDTTTINLQMAVRDIDDLRKHLGNEQISLCGISWGGGLAQAYASFYPKNLKKMILVSSMGPDLEFWQPMLDNIVMRRYPYEKDSLQLWNSKPSDKNTDLKKFIYSQLPYFYDHDLGYKEYLKIDIQNVPFSQNESELMWKDLYKTYDLKAKLLNFKGECIVIKGRQDIIPADASYQIKEWVPQTKIIIIEKCGHYPFMEKPKEFYQNLKKAFSDNR
jgi:proline iminopeptidase